MPDYWYPANVTYEQRDASKIVKITELIKELLDEDYITTEKVIQLTLMDRDDLLLELLREIKRVEDMLDE